MPKSKSSPKKDKDFLLEEYSESLVTPEDRDSMIAEAAYYRAEQRGFDPSGVYEDWFEAEKIVDKILMKEVKETVDH